MNKSRPLIGGLTIYSANHAHKNNTCNRTVTAINQNKKYGKIKERRSDRSNILEGYYILSVSHKSESVNEVNERTHTKNKIPYSRGSLEVPTN